MSDIDTNAPADSEAVEAEPTVAPSELAPEAQQRMVEIEALMSDMHSAYHKGPEAEKLQAEYLALQEADVRGLPAEMTEPETVASWAEHLDVPPEQVLDGMQRAEEITAEVGDTGELMTAFSGLADRVQWVCRRALAAPEMRIELIQGLTDEEYNQLGGFLDAMTPAEHKAVEKALGL
jgi:hypothetical protein